MAAAFLVLGGSRTTAAPLDDLQARSRRFLRRGLLLSGALHLTLLAAVLWMASRGDEGVVRLVGGRIAVTPEVVNIPIPPPSARVAPPSEPTDNGSGVIVPIDKPKIDLPFNPFVGAEQRATEGGGPREQHRTDPGPPPGPGEPPVFQSGEVDKLPVEIFAPKPRYPDFELQVGITGRAVMKVLVDEEGVVRSVDRLSGSKPFVDAAKETLYRWRFKPALVKGKPVRVWLEIPVNFVL